MSAGTKYQRPTPKVLTEPYWFKQRDESDLAFKYFQIYRDGAFTTEKDGKTETLKWERRTIQKVSEVVHRHIKHIERISRLWRWKDRLLAYDRHLDEERRLRFEKERRKADDSTLVIARAMRAKVLKRLTDEQGGIYLNEKTLPAWFKECREAEAMVLGGPTARVEITEGPEVILERRMRTAVTDIIELHRDNPEVPIEERVKWAVTDYELDFDSLYAAVESEMQATSNSVN